MTKVELKNNTIVRFAKGTVLEVSDAEASRLVALNNAVIVNEPKAAEDKTQKRSKKRSE